MSDTTPEREPDAASDAADELPPAFARALRRELDPPAGVPPAVDAAILARARAALTARARAPRRRLLRPRTWAGIGSLAAAALLALLWPRKLDPLDVDGDGRVDVIDAYQLARAVERGERSARLDLDGNGVAERADAQVVLARVVGGQGVSQGTR